MIQRAKNTGLKWLWITLVVVVLDQITKIWASSTLILNESVVPVMPGFNFVLRHNLGAAFSFLADSGGWQRWFLALVAIVVSVALIVVLYKQSSKEKLTGIAYSLVLGGALGNVYDRIAYGYVVDFIDWYYGTAHWPAFNIADSAICLGVGLLILDMFVNKDDTKSADKKADSGSRS